MPPRKTVSKQPAIQPVADPMATLRAAVENARQSEIKFATAVNNRLRIERELEQAASQCSAADLECRRAKAELDALLREQPQTKIRELVMVGVSHLKASR